MNKKLLLALLCATGATACTAGLTACAHQHVYTDEWKHTATEHWQVCTEDGEESERSAHSWERTELTKEASCTADGSEKLACTVCGLTKTADIPKLGHDLSWVYDCENHHEVCSRGDKTDLEENHEFTKTTGANGLVTITCKCGYTATGEASGTPSNPLEMTADKTSYSVILNPSEMFETSDSSYYAFTPAKNATLTLTCDANSRGAFSVGYYQITTDRGEEIKNFIASETKPVAEEGRTGVSVEVAKGVEYVVAVHTSTGAVQNLDFELNLHEHEYAEEWSADGSSHWHASTCHADTAMRSDEGAHNFTGGMCTVCKQKMTGTECLIYANENEETMTIKVSGVKSGETLPEHVVIPETVEKNGKIYTVTEILSNTNMFNGNFNIQSITLPRTITKIANNAFKSCEALKTVNIFDLKAYMAIELGGTTSAPLNACTEGGEIYLNGELLENINVEADSNVGGVFANCASIKTVKITAKSGLEELITVSAFSKMPNLTSIEIGDGIGNFGGATNCAQLNNVLLGDDLTDLGSFSNCSVLASISIPQSVTTVGSFSNCSELDSISFPQGVTKIGVFTNCTKLESIVIPDGVTAISSSGFSGCTSLTTVIIPASITEIGRTAFKGCTALENLVVMGIEAVTIKTSAFNGCTVLNNVYFNGTSEQWDTVKETWQGSNGIPTTATVHFEGEWELVEGAPQLKAQV